MTVVNVTAALTALGGSEPVTSGRITVEYLRGKDGEPATRAVGAAVTLPTPIVIAIVDGSPVEPVDVPPTDGTCYARVWVECRVPRDAGFLELPAVAIPASGPVDITALVAVDPASFDPVTTVVTAWQLAVDQVAAMRDVVTAKTMEAVEAATDAGTFAGATEFDANRAGLSAFQAGQSAASALGHKNDAKTSADAAAASAASLVKDVPGGVPTLDGDARVPDVRLPERLAPEALSSTIGVVAVAVADAAVVRSVSALRVLIDGDSIAAQCPDEDDITANGFANAYSWAEWANTALGDRIRVVENKGVGGQRSSQVLARIDASLAVDCDIVFLSVLTNDLFDGTGTTVAAMKTNMAAIYQAHLAKGRIVVHLIPGPSGYATTPTLANQYEMHNWLREYARTHPGIYLVNAHAVAASPSDGLPLNYYARPEDNAVRGVHPGYLWAAKIGQELAAVLEPVMWRVPVLESPSNVDPRNVLTNGKMLGSSGGIATGYTVVKTSDGSAATVTASKVVRADGRPGEVQQIIVDPAVYAAQAPSLFIQDTTPGGRWNVGDTVRLVVHFETDPDTAGSYPTGTSLTFWNGLGSTGGIGKRSADVNLPAGVDALPRKGVYRTPWKAIPAGTGRLQVRIPLPYGTTRILSVEIQKAV